MRSNRSDSLCLIHLQKTGLQKNICHFVPNFDYGRTFSFVSRTPSRETYVPLHRSIQVWCGRWLFVIADLDNGNVSNCIRSVGPKLHELLRAIVHWNRAVSSWAWRANSNDNFHIVKRTRLDDNLVLEANGWIEKRTWDGRTLIICLKLFYTSNYTKTFKFSK